MSLKPEYVHFSDLVICMFDILELSLFISRQRRTRSSIGAILACLRFHGVLDKQPFTQRRWIAENSKLYSICKLRVSA
jgi:hypothetical protein